MLWKPTMKSETMVKGTDIFAFDSPINCMNMRSKCTTINLRLTFVYTVGYGEIISGYVNIEHPFLVLKFQ